MELFESLRKEQTQNLRKRKSHGDKTQASGPPNQLCTGCCLQNYSKRSDLSFFHILKNVITLLGEIQEWVRNTKYLGGTSVLFLNSLVVFLLIATSLRVNFHEVCNF